MVQFTPSDNPACGHFLLSPNNSAGWHGNQCVLYAAGLFGLGMMLFTWLHGAVWVTYFCGAELVFLYCGLWRVSRDCARQELVILTPDKVIIQKGHESLEQEWHFQRFQTQIHIAEPQPEGHLHGDVAFCYRQHAVHLGAFLGDEERAQLISQLRRLVGDYRRSYLQR